MCGVVHTSIKVFADKFYDELVRRVYTTPKSYLDLINSYTAKLGVLQGAVETKAQQMEVRVCRVPCRNKLVCISLTILLLSQYNIDAHTDDTATIPI